MCNSSESNEKSKPFADILHVKMTSKEGCVLIVSTKRSKPQIGDIVTLKVQDGIKTCNFRVAQIDHCYHDKNFTIGGIAITPTENIIVCTLHEVNPFNSDVYINRENEFDLSEIYFNSTIRI